MIGLYIWVRVNDIIHLPEILLSPMHILHLSFHMGKGKGKGKRKSEMRISSIDLRQDHDETIFFLHDWVVHTICVRNSFLIFMYSYPLPQS